MFKSNILSHVNITAAINNNNNACRHGDDCLLLGYANMVALLRENILIDGLVSADWSSGIVFIFIVLYCGFFIDYNSEKYNFVDHL